MTTAGGLRDRLTRGRRRAARAADEEAADRRRREVEACLAEHGLVRAPHRLAPPPAAAPPSSAPASARLGRALVELGGPFPLFGLYLSTRPDLLPAQDCRQLAAIPDLAPALPPPAVEALLARELGAQPAALFAALETVPFESRRLAQRHRARLPDGREVIVKIARPGLPAAWADDLALLPLAAVALVDDEARERAELAANLRRALAAAAGEFSANLAARLDLTREAADLELLAADLGAAAFELLAAPRPCRGLCSPRVLTTERLPGSTLAERLTADAAGTAGAVGAAGADLARRLCLAWLRQALLGTRFPVDVRAAEVQLLPDRQLAFSGGPFAGLAPASQVTLWDYLIATAAQDPDRACSRLLAELKGEGEPAPGGGPGFATGAGAKTGGPGAVAEVELRAKLRQVVPFRDGSWRDGGADSLAEHLFVHWRLASERGFQAAAPLVAFYRGLCSLAALVRPLCPRGDPLHEGLQDLRVSAGMLEMRRALSARGLAGSLERYAAALLSLPQGLDRALDRAAGEAAPLRIEIPPAQAPGAGRRQDAAALTAVLGLALGALALLLAYCARQGLLAPWGERLGAGLFLLLGALLVWVAQRSS